MKYLGVDFGQKNIGLAWSDTTLGMVLPYGIIKNAKELAELAESEGIQKIVIGWPVSAKGEENKNTEKVKKFAYEINKLTEIPVDFSDERFTSQAADAAGGGVSRDEKSAMIILEGYLSREHKNTRA